MREKLNYNHLVSAIGASAGARAKHEQGNIVSLQFGQSKSHYFKCSRSFYPSTPH